MPSDELAQVRDDRRVVSGVQLGLIKILERHHPAVLEPLRLDVEFGNVQSLVRCAAPQCEGLTNQLGGPVRIGVRGGCSFVEQFLESGGVELSW